MSYANAGYWQAQANACKQYADEGACLERIAQRSGQGITIVPGFGGLGQADSLTTLAPRSVDIMAVQSALIHAGALTIRTADGLISATSPTLTAIRSWATANGLSSTGVARTSSGGLVIPASLLARILAITTAAPSVTKTASDDTSDVAAPSAVLPGIATDHPMPGWLPWAVGGAAVLAAGAFLMGAGTGARVAANGRRRRRNRRAS